MKWRQLFQPHILERGRRYYCEGAVRNLKISANTLKAEVIGTHEYEVEIVLDDKEDVVDMYCCCPYAEEGWTCKHMAAVLFEWTEGKKQYESLEHIDQHEILFMKAYTQDAVKKKKEAIQHLIENADIGMVKSYLTSILFENEKLLSRFYHMVSVNSEEIDMKYYIKKIDEIEKHYLGIDEFISYDEVRRFILELEEIYRKDVRHMIENEQYMMAFELINYIFTLVGNADMDDSDGSTAEIAEQTYELWLELLEKVNIKEKQEMFQWFTTHLNGSMMDYFEEYIEDIIMEEFTENKYLLQKLDFTEEMIKKVDKESDWSRNYYIEKWAIYHLNLMETRNCSREEIQAYCKKYWATSAIRKYYIDLCMEEKEYDLALKALEESMSLDRGYAGLLAEYSKKKKEIYLIQGNKAEYIKQLRELVLQYEVGNLEVYRELKRQYTKKEWINQREFILKKFPKYAHIDQFYEEEKLYDRLLEFVLHSSGLSALQQYTKVLKKQYSQQLLEKYKEEVNRLAHCAKDRKKYQELLSVLRSMRKINGGVQMVEDIIQEWKVQYKNRPAMMEELSKL